MHFFEIGSIYTFFILELLKLPKIAQISTPVRLYCAFLVAWKMAVTPAVVITAGSIACNNICGSYLHQGNVKECGSQKQ